MAVLTPLVQGSLTSVPVTLSGTVAVGQVVSVDGAAVALATTPIAGIAAESGVSGDVIAVYTDGIFTATDSGSSINAGTVQAVAWAAAHTIATAVTGNVILGYAIEDIASGATGTIRLAIGGILA